MLLLLFKYRAINVTYIPLSGIEVVAYMKRYPYLPGIASRIELEDVWVEFPTSSDSILGPY